MTWEHYKDRCFHCPRDGELFREWPDSIYDENKQIIQFLMDIDMDGSRFVKYLQHRFKMTIFLVFVKSKNDGMRKLRSYDLISDYLCVDFARSPLSMRIVAAPAYQASEDFQKLYFYF